MKIMFKIYQYVRDPNYYLIPLFREFGDRNEHRSVCVYLNIGEVQWGLRGTNALITDRNYYREVGEIDLNSVVLDAIKQVIGEQHD